MNKLGKSTSLTGPLLYGQDAEATSHCVKVWLTENRLSNWIHKNHCTQAQDPTERTLTEVRTDLGTSPTDKD